MLRSNTLLVLTALTLIGLVASSCQVVPAKAEQVLGTISVEDPTTHLHTIDITVGSIFKVDIWARDIPEPGMVDFRFRMVWNPKLIGFVSRDIHDHGFGMLAETIDSGMYELEIASPFPHSPFINDASWVTFTFRCLGEGSSAITIAYSHGYYGNYGHELYFSPEDGTINQHPAPARGVAHSVGETGVLLPWLAAFGVAGCIAIVVAVSNRRSRGRHHSTEIRYSC